MKVLLIKDVYNLGRAGDVKKVADGYGRNFLIPQGLAMLATPGAVKTAERIRAKATERRVQLNDEMSVVAEALKNIHLAFAARAGETGKLYGSITSQEVADAIREKSGYEVKRQQLDMQPLRMLGEHTINVRLTMDLIPEIKAIVYREGEAEPTLETDEVQEAQPVEAATTPAPSETSEEAAPDAQTVETVVTPVSPEPIEEATPEEPVLDEPTPEEPAQEEPAPEEPADADQS